MIVPKAQEQPPFHPSRSQNHRKAHSPRRDKRAASDRQGSNVSAISQIRPPPEL